MNSVLETYDEPLLFMWGGSVFLAMIAMSYVWQGGSVGKSVVRKRLYSSNTSVALKATKIRWEAISRLLEAVRYFNFLIPGSLKDREDVRTRLRHAGFRSPSAETLYYLLRLLSMLCFPALVHFGSVAFEPLAKHRETWEIVALGIGVILPSYLLDRRVQARQTRLRQSLPDTLDLLVVCAESGLSANSALIRVVRELDALHPELTDELEQLIFEIQSGRDRTQAFANLDSRCGIRELRSFGMVLNQSLRLGTSVADTLRVYSEEYRQERMQAAEEKAAKIGTKMIFPLAFCFLPCFFIVAVGPAFIRIIGAMK